VGLRGHGRTGQVHGAEGAKRVRPVARLSATGYVEWVLGDLRPKSAMHVITEVDPGSGALFARNPYNTEFATGLPSSTWTRSGTGP
jgi:cellobiose phosphorylase